jgi:beta-glucanase (GH16 family)
MIAFPCQLFMRLIVFAPICIASAFSAAAQDTTGWTLVWADEFTQANGSSPDPARWTHDLGGGGWGNREWQYYTSRTNNVRIEDGKLVIEARAESHLGSNYTSARLKTQGKASWTYGRIEARIKIPQGQGIWPAFWMLGTNITSVNWPNCGEIDILENIGREPAIVHGTVHGPGYSGGNGIGGPYSLSNSAPFADDFHVYAIEWTTNSIKWFVDGRQYFSINPASLPNGANWVFTQPQFLLLNLAVGGNWPGYPDATTTFPQRLIVDYVRVYAPAALTGCTINQLLNPGFESGGLAGWTTYGAGFNTLLEPITSVSVHDGTNVFKVFGRFTGGENYSGLYQDLPAGEGQSFAASGWAFTPDNDAIAGGNTAWIEVTFREGPNLLELYRSALIDAETPAGAWLNLAVTNQLNPANSAVIGSVTNLVAPANTSIVRCQVVFWQPAMSAGAVLFDDLRLVPGGENLVPVAASIGQAHGDLNLSFQTFLNRPYEVHWKTNLADPDWLVLTNVSGDGATKGLSLNPPISSSFYRVTRLCD